MKMTRYRMALAGLLLLAGTSAAQTTTNSVMVGEPQYIVSQLTGVVVAVDGNSLLAQVAPDGDYRWFDVVPGRQFVIDGQPKTIAQLTPGTVLTATVVTKIVPVDYRTTTITNGTILAVNGRHLSARLENGTRHTYTVPDNFMFTVDGKDVPIYDLKPGMRATATRIVSDPEAEISSLTVVTGKAPK